jgi:hypothetical protein
MLEQAISIDMTCTRVYEEISLVEVEQAMQWLTVEYR